MTPEDIANDALDFAQRNASKFGVGLYKLEKSAAMAAEFHHQRRMVEAFDRPDFDLKKYLDENNLVLMPKKISPKMADSGYEALSKWYLMSVEKIYEAFVTAGKISP